METEGRELLQVVGGMMREVAKAEKRVGWVRF